MSFPLREQQEFLISHDWSFFKLIKKQLIYTRNDFQLIDISGVHTGTGVTFKLRSYCSNSICPSVGPYRRSITRSNALDIFFLNCKFLFVFLTHNKSKVFASNRFFRLWFTFPDEMYQHFFSKYSLPIVAERGFSSHRSHAWVLYTREMK